MAQPRVAVVGAGLAGLAAAVDLADAGFAVEIFERSRLVGGRATSFVVNGREVDNGQHVFLACCNEFIDFVRRLGLGGELHIQPRFEAVMIARGGRVGRLRAASLPAPWHLIGSLMRFGLLGWRSKMRIATALASARGRHGAVELVSTDRSKEFSGSFGAWLQERGQTEVELRSFWEPFFVPAFNAPLDAVAAADALGVIDMAFMRDAGAARFGYSKIPLARVATAAANRAGSLHLAAPVAQVTVDDGAGRARGLTLTSGEKVELDALVVAVAPPQLARLFEQPARAGLPALDRFIPFPIVDAHLWHDGDDLGFDFAALIDSPVQWVFEKGPGYLCCSISAAGEYLTMPTEHLVQTCWLEVVSALPTLAQAKVVDAAVTRNSEATYLPHPGTVRPGTATALANVALAGSWTATGWPDTMESAVRSGRAAAKHLVNFFAAGAGTADGRPKVDRSTSSSPGIAV